MANSLWLFAPATYTNIPNGTPSLGYSFQNTLSVNGSGTVSGFPGYAWGVVNANNVAGQYIGNFGNNIATFSNPLTFNNANTAIAGSIDANFVGANPNTSLLITGLPSFLGGQIAPAGGGVNQPFTASVVTIESLTNISTLDIAVNGGSNTAYYLLGEYGANFTNNSVSANSGVFSTNVILGGGGMANSSYTPISMGSLTLGVGTNYVTGQYNNGNSFTFSSMTGLTNSTPVSGAVLADTTNGNGYASVAIAGKSTTDNINGIAGGWAVHLNGGNSADWATYGSDGALNALTGVDTGGTGAGYTYDEGILGLSDGGQSVTAVNWTATENINMGSSVSGTAPISVYDALTQDTTINSLRFGVASSVASGSYYLTDATLELGGYQLVINTGGIIGASAPNYTSSSPFTIQDSYGGVGITAGVGSNYNLYIYPGAGGVNGTAGTNLANQGGNASATIVISAPITDNGSNAVSVTVSSSTNGNGAPGNVYLYGANTYTGNTYLVGPAAAAINSDRGWERIGNQVVFNGGQLYINYAIPTFGHQIVVEGGNGGLIIIEPIGNSTGGINGDDPTSGLVLTNSGTAPAITGSGPLTIQSDSGVNNGLPGGSNPGNADIVELNGQSSLTGPLLLQNNNYNNFQLDLFLKNNTGVGYALNSDTYLNASHGSVNLVWLAANQVNPTAVIDVTDIGNPYSQANIQLSGFSDTIGGLVETDLAGYAGTGVGLVQSNGTNGTSTLTINTQYRPDVNNNVYTYTGQISGQTGGGADNSGVINIVKTGPATQVFSGPNSYTGTTTVKAGALIIENDATGPTGVVHGGNYTVSGGSDLSNPYSATLGGYGTILGPTAFTAQGTDSTHLGIIHPGTNGLAAMTSSNKRALSRYSNGTTAPSSNQTSTAFNDFSELKLDIDSGSYTTANSATFSFSSVLAINGNVTIGANTTLDLNFLNGTTPTGTYLLLVTDAGSGTSGNNPFTGDGLGTISGTFTNVLNLPSNYQIDYSIPGEILLDAVVVPEPSTWAMMLGGLALLLVFAERRRRTARV